MGNTEGFKIKVSSAFEPFLYEQVAEEWIT